MTSTTPGFDVAQADRLLVTTRPADRKPADRKPVTYWNAWKRRA
ncbi:MAG TPA: hypothetical protein VF743_09595 [Acidimicrobiales bacterium]